MTRNRLAVVLVAASTASLAACGGGNTPAATGTTTVTTAGVSPAATSTTTASTTPPTTVPATAIPASQLSPAGQPGHQPTLRVPGGKPPTGLEEADLIKGTGPAAKSGDNVSVQYVLGTYSSHKVVQSSWGSSTGAFSFTLGANQVVPGFDQGVQGMKVGGRREVIIPPGLGYGSQSQGPGIAANDTLVFIIDLVKIN